MQQPYREADLGQVSSLCRKPSTLLEDEPFSHWFLHLGADTQHVPLVGQLVLVRPERGQKHGTPQQHVHAGNRTHVGESKRSVHDSNADVIAFVPKDDVQPQSDLSLDIWHVWNAVVFIVCVHVHEETWAQPRSQTNVCRTAATARMSVPIVAAGTRLDV